MPTTLEHAYFLNPDGSGKVTVQWEFPLDDSMPDPATLTRNEISMSSGIEAWGFAAAHPAGDRVIFTGAAYFRDLASVRFHCQGFHVGLLELSLSLDPEGRLVLASGEPAPAPFEITPDATDEELRARLEPERRKYADMRQFLENFIAGLSCGTTFFLPGQVGSTSGGQPVGERAVRATLSGAAVLDAFDRAFEDDDHMFILMRGGPAATALIASLFPGGGPLRAVVEPPFAPLFDYEMELSVAKQQGARMEAAGAEASPPAVPMENPRVAAVRVVREADHSREFTPFGNHQTSLAFVFAGELPEAVREAAEGRMEACLTDDGLDLLPSEDWNRRIHFPKLTSDGHTVWFEVELPLPGEGTRGLREFRATITCRVAESFETVDLGFTALAAGETGASHGASIEQVSDEEEGRQVLELKLGVSRSAVDTVIITDPDGTEVPAEPCGYSSWGDECTLSFRLARAADPAGRIALRLATDLRDVNASFALTDIDLLGRPAGRED
ncbi:MAG: hypothetical protein MUE73_02070 [Planctomycetes bacterium]|nr:hypothetical protein [Planctomycetota bacterium]